jgi:hypothetical protein
MWANSQKQNGDLARVVSRTYREGQMTIDTFATEMMAGFSHLNIVDLLVAREQYHVFLTKHPNVVATAIGRYLIRDEGVDENAVRTLANSHVDLDKSWPCVLVFVDQWQSEKELVGSKSPGAVVPKTLYLPDGRAVPVCIVQAQRDLEPVDAPLRSEIVYPKNIIAGGFPLEVSVQGRDHVATVGCLVTDGSKYYGLTNRHVCGEEGRVIYARLGGDLVEVGTAASRELQLSKIAFADMYPGWPGAHLFVNADVGLVDIDDVNCWKTDIFQVGEVGPIADLNANNLALSVIGTKVRGFGAGSGPINGRVSALFYRYRSMGGIEYVSDFLIGPNGSETAVVRHGDSGAVLSLDLSGGLRPFAINWGVHEFIVGSERTSMGFALATGLGNVCRLLDIDLVRGWNVDQPYTWGKTGHFKIGFRAADLVSNAKLAAFMAANQASLGISNDQLTAKDGVNGKFTHDFVPLADVADIIWRTTRPDDESNHFSDIDESDPSVFQGKTLLQLSLANDANIDVDVWLDFDRQMDAAKPVSKTNRDGEEVPRPREGALPFRVWQMYKQMISSLRNGALDEFVTAGGTMAHYVGDACQPLHISFLHHGANPSEAAVHSDYETTMIDRKAAELFEGVDNINTKVAAGELIGPNGKDAARFVLQLMKSTVDLLPPEEVLEVWRKSKGRGKFDHMWDELGDRTIQTIAAGSHAMAVLWQSAWIHGKGDDLPESALVKIPESRLQELYSKKTFVPSFRLSNPADYESVL